MKTKDWKWIAIGALASLLTACGAEERARRHPVTIAQDGAKGSSDASVKTDDPAALEAIAECEAASRYICGVEAAIISYTNAARLSQGIAPFEYGAKLGFAAREWSEIQADENALSHEGFPSEREALITEEFGADSGTRVLGENIAQNMMQQNAQETGRAIANQWWNSPFHKQNILGNFPAIGVGVGLRGNKIYATQIFGQDLSGK